MSKQIWVVNTIKIVLLEKVQGAVDKLLPLLLVLGHPAVLRAPLVPTANCNHNLRQQDAILMFFECQRVQSSQWHLTMSFVLTLSAFHLQMRPSLPQVGGFSEPGQTVVFLKVHPGVQRFDGRFCSVKPGKALNEN